MKKLKKLFTYCLVAICSLTFVVLAAGCDKEKGSAECTVAHAEETRVVIVVSEAKGEFTLEDCMKQLKKEGSLSYEVKDGMLTKLNGKENEGNGYWMLYTSDDEFGNESWGTVVYEELTFKSATLGMESLNVKSGETYVWEYQIMSW